MQLERAAGTMPANQPAAATPATSPIPAVEQARAVPWFMDLHVAGERVEDIIERTPRFRFEGDGPLSTRTIVPETQAARNALEGASAPKVEQALRGLLATFDAQSGVTNLESIGFSVDGASAAVNHVLGGMSWPEASLGVPTIDPAAGSRERRQVKAALVAQAKELDDADAQGSTWGVSYRSINVAPAVTRGIFNSLADPANANKEDVDYQSHVLVHEVAHRLSEPPLEHPDFAAAEPDERQLARWSKMQLLSEGSADLITHLPGFKNDAQQRMGLPVSPEEPFPSGYDMFIDTLTSVLHQAGLDPRAPEHREQIIELLERDEMERVPDALATLIVQKQGIDWSRHHEIATAIGAIGEHGKIPEDEESFAEVRAELEQRTIAAEDLIGRLASESKARRERAAP
jgi:hypothetical protein